MLGRGMLGSDTSGMETLGIDTSGIATRGILGIVRDDISGFGMASLHPVCTISGE